VENAHERFGWLEFTRVLKDTTARVRLRLDRMVAEAGKDSPEGRLHLVSVIGGDSDVGAAWAAVQQNQVFRVKGPGLDTRLEWSLGEKTECFRGSINVPGIKRPVRHLVAVSAELAGTRLGAATMSSRTILCNDNPIFVLYRVSERFGLPVVPEWAGWFTAELQKRKAITRLVAIGCAPVLITGSKGKFLSWISRALRRGVIQFPATNGSLVWPEMEDFLGPREASPVGPEH
jgi:hypothetical protein